MFRLGIIDTISLAGTLVFAIPMVLIGVEKVLDGDLAMGLFFLGLAAAAIGLQQYLTSTRRAKRGLVRKFTGSSAEDDE